MTQQQLLFRAVKQSADSLLPKLQSALQGRGWRTARHLAVELHTDDRVIREAAAQSDGTIISGQKGYALLSEASVADAQHAADWLRSQARQMTQRAYQIEQALHKRTA